MSKTRTYTSEDITVTYDVGKCIHAAECVRGVPAVFDPNARPWIQPENATAKSIAAVIARCPTGALHYESAIDGLVEVCDSRNSITTIEDGPLYVRGDVVINNSDGDEVERGPRFALCRCGASGNKPFCDNSHKEISFRAPPSLGDGGIKEVEYPDSQEELCITPSHNGPLLLSGPVTIKSADGTRKRTGLKTALCRCGHSSNKPFCDGSHRTVGFDSEK